MPCFNKILYIFCLLFILCFQLGKSNPIQIIQPSGSHEELDLLEENLYPLSSLEKISIIGVIGPYHSGKSSLLNSFLKPNFNAKFKVGSSTSAQTLGAWLLVTDLKANDNSTIVLLDTEGFFGTNISEVYDARIFAVATLLSSHLIYTSVKLIDQNAVDYLELLARRAQLFQYKQIVEKSNSDDLLSVLKSQEFPPLTWVVKDFSQNTQDKTPQQWLDGFIEGSRDPIKTHRNGLKSIFTKGIHCKTLFIPATQKSQLEDISLVPESEFTEEYKREVKALIYFILNKVEAKNIESEGITGPNLITLLKFLVPAINGNKFPTVPSLWNSWIRDLILSSQADTFQFYDSNIDQIHKIFPPVSEDEFQIENNNLITKSIEIYKQLLFGFESLYHSGLPKLNEELNKRKLFHEDLNIKKIYEVLKEEKDRCSVQHDSMLDNFELPLPSNQLEIRLNEVEDEIIKKFATFSKKYKNGRSYQEILANLEKTISAKENQIRLKNKNLRESILTNANNRFKSTFRKELRSTQILTPSQLQQRKIQAEKKASIAFDQEIENTNKEWLKSETDYKAMRALCREEIEKEYDTYFKENEKRIGIEVKSYISSISSDLSRNLNRIRPFPDEKEVLHQRALEELQKMESLLHERFNGFSESQAFRIEAQTLQSIFQTEEEDLLKKNLATIQVQCSKVFDCAMQIVDKNYCYFCLQNLLPFMFTNMCFRAAEDCFQKFTTSMDFQPSSNLKKEVINNWISLNVAAKYGSSLWQSISTLIFLILIGGGLTVVFLGAKSGTSTGVHIPKRH